VREARLDRTDSGLAPATAGWFVVNVRDAAWETGAFGDACFFENGQAPFEQLGISVRVLWPGRSRWLYHAESAQEDFLVLSGEALLLVEEAERPLRPWDFVHCPPGTAHAFVAVGERPCAIVMVGARPPGPKASSISLPSSRMRSCSSHRSPPRSRTHSSFVELLTAGRSCILDFGLWSREERDALRLRARRLGVRVELHYVNVELAELIRRTAQRCADAPETAPDISAEQLAVWASSFQAPSSAEQRLFDAPLAAPQRTTAVAPG